MVEKQDADAVTGVGAAGLTREGELQPPGSWRPPGGVTFLPSWLKSFVQNITPFSGSGEDDLVKWGHMEEVLSLGQRLFIRHVCGQLE